MMNPERNNENTILYVFNDTDYVYPDKATIFSLFEEQAARFPQNISLICNGQQLSYQDFNEKSNQLARFLRKAGVKGDSIVAIMTEPSFEMAVGIMAILKAGGAYLPIDPSYPVDRINYMLHDSGASIILTQSHLKHNLMNKAEAIYLDKLDISQEEKSNLGSIINSRNLAYIIYTSGTTGKPKGVMVEHRSAVNTLFYRKNEYHLTPDDTALEFFSFAFDGFVTIFFTPLISGAKVVILGKDEIHDVEKIRQIIIYNKVTNIISVPALYGMLLESLRPDEMRTLKIVTLAGDTIPEKLVKDSFHKSESTEISVEYGVTEAAVMSTIYRHQEKDPQIKIGKPTGNTKILILDEDLKIVPVGTVGELCISGAGLARGYIKKPELTAEKFIPNPYTHQNKLAGYEFISYASVNQSFGHESISHASFGKGLGTEDSRPGTQDWEPETGELANLELSNSQLATRNSQLIYKTGDLAKWEPDGNIIFLGRKDNQVKIRGFRIETSEIENRLLEYGGILKTAVIARNNETGQKYLCAYYVSAGTIETEHLKSFLAQQLPSYMIPQFIMKINEMPLTPNGKIDRNALPEPLSVSKTRADYRAPRTQLEKTIIKIWEQVLGIRKISLTDNFFHLGGDSIKAMQIATRLLSFGFKLKVKDLVNNPSPERIIPYIKSMKLNHQNKEESGDVPLTPIQKWFFENNFAAKHHWNQAFMLHSKGRALDENHLETAMNQLIKHHDVLRTVFRGEGSAVRQYIRPSATVTYKLEVYDFRGSMADDNLMNEKINETQRSFDLNGGLLIKAALFRTDHGDNILFTAHHLIIDSVSFRIILEDLTSAYDALESGQNALLPDKTTSYKEWAVKLAEIANEPFITNEIPYWKNILQYDTRLLNEAQPVSEDTFQNSQTVTIRLSKSETHNLVNIAGRAYNTKINDLLLAALVIALKEYSGKNDILINMESHGREELFDELDITRTIGWFTASFPVLFNLSEDFSLGKSIITVKETLRNIPKNGLGFGILRYLTPDSGITGASPKPEINFNFLGEIDSRRQSGVFHIEEVDLLSCISGKAKRNFKWDIYGFIKEQLLFIHINYNKNQFNQGTINSFSKNLKELLLNIISHCLSLEYTEFTKSDFNLAGFTDGQFEIVKGKLNEELRLNNIKDMYFLSPMQEGMLYSGIYHQDSDSYFQQMMIGLDGAVESRQIETAFNLLVKKHDVLRTLFLWEEIPRPIQVVLKERPVKLYITTTTESDKPRILKKIMQADREAKFRLDNEPLLRIKLVKISDTKFSLLISFHHIIIDGWCFGLIFDDFLSIIAKLRNGGRIEPGPVTQYSKYIKWLSGFNKDAARIYWEEYLADYNLPAYIGRTLPATKCTSAHVKEKLITIGNRLGADVIDFAKRNESTLNTVFQTAWGLLLQKYRMRDDVVFGYVVSGRPPEIEAVEKMTGLFINTVPLRIKADRDSAFIDVLQRVKADNINAKPYDNLSLAEIQSLSAARRGLFDHIMIYENFPVGEYIHDPKTKQRTGFEITGIEVFEKTEYDFTVTITPQNQSFLILFQYTGGFDGDWVEIMGNHFINMVQCLIYNCHQRIGELKMISGQEKDLILKTLARDNHPAKDGRLKTNVKELFEQAAAIYSKNTAVRFREQSITYHELNERSNKLAYRLIAAGACRDEIIGLLFYPSIEMIISILAALKSGAAYLPLEPDLPESRINYLLSDSAANILVRGSENTFKCPARLKEIIIDQEHTADFSGQNPDIRIASDSLAYVIYTSGTTGNPKGVLVEHRNLIAYINAFNDYFTINSKDIFLQQASYSFDAFVEEMYPALLKGGTIAVLPRDLAKDMVRLWEYAAKSKVTMISASPLLLNELDKMETIESVHTYISGGDVLKIEYIQNLLTRGKVVNTYGPTEATVCCAYYECHKDDELIPIGKPIAGYEILILDENKSLQPLLIPGEIHIGGEGVTRGYLNRDELTRTKFIPHPYKPGEIIYCSGDYAKVLPDGNLEFLGRIDTQVKIRGFRIETEEIEKKLLEYGAVFGAGKGAIGEAVVVSRKGRHNEDELCAYFTSAKEISVNQLRDYLATILPVYMIPAYFIRLAKIPVTISGKVNPAELPEPYLLINTGAEYIEPSTQNEKTLVKVIKNVLSVDRVSIGDKFLNLGGDSLKAIRVVGSLKEYSINLGLNSLMANTTFKELAAHLEHPHDNQNNNHFQGEVKLHPYHIALFYHTFPDNFAGAAKWNTSGMFLSSDRLDFNIVKMVVTELVRYHDALRTVFYEEQGVIKQYTPSAEAYEAEVLYFDFSGFKDKLHERLLNAMAAIQTGFKLDRLFKTALFRTDVGDYIYFTGNHLITDAYSDNILYEDFFAGYNQAISHRKIKFFPKTDSYAAWIEKLYEYSKSPQLLAEIDYWKGVVTPSALSLDKDFPPSPGEETLENVADLVSELLDETSTALLKMYSFKNKRRIFDILLCAWSTSVYKLAGVERTRVFCVNNGRNYFDNAIDVSRTVGSFMILYPVLVDLKEAPYPETHLEYITNLINDLPGQGFGFEILKYLTENRLKGNEQFRLPDYEKETFFNYLGEFTEDGAISGFNAGQKVQPVYLIGDININRSTKARWTNDFNIFLSLMHNKLSVRFQYSIHEYKKETVQKAIDEFRKNIMSLINNEGA